MLKELETYCHEGCMPHIVVNNNRTLSLDQVLRVLRYLRTAISVGLPLTAIDSEDAGNKFTHCSWGLCTGDIRAWPDPAMHVFPQEFILNGRVDPLDQPVYCPMDSGDVAGRGDDPRYGCFYRCRIFKQGLRNREKALMLFDRRIAETEAQLAAQEGPEGTDEVI